MKTRPHWAVEILGADLRSLALLRICLGFMMFLDLVLRARDLTAHYTDYGVLPRGALIDLGWNDAYVSIYMISGHWSVIALLFLLAMAVNLLLMVGYRTCLMSWLSWFMLISLQNRNPMVLNGGDIVLRVVVFWALFLPWGARWSLDARNNPRWGDLPNCVYSPATLAYLFQVCMVYLFAALLKTGAQWHRDGTAVYYALSLDQFTTRWGKMLLMHPDLCKFFTHATWTFEALVSLLLVFPFLNGPIRTLAVLGIASMHLGFGIAMHIGVFVPIGMVWALGLLPAWFWDQWDRLRLQPPAFLSRLPASPVRSELPVNYHLPLWQSIVVVFLTGYAIIWNIGTLRGPVKIPPKLEFIGLAVKLDQIWNMFAPYPLTEDGWFVVDAVDRANRHFDLFKNGGPVSWEKPEWVSSTYKNERWRKYMMNLWLRDYAGYRLYYGRYLCRSWNDTHPATEQVKTFDLVFMLERTLPDYQQSTPEKVILWSHDCFKRD